MTNEIQKILEKYNEIDQIIMEEVLPESSGHRSNPTVYKALMYLQASISFLIYNHYHKAITLSFVMPGHWRKVCGIKTGAKIKREELKKRDIEFVESKFNITVNDDEADGIGIAYSYVLEQGKELGAW